LYDSLKITPKTRGYQVVFNHTNFHLYHYAGNNPNRYTDPDGRFFACWYLDNDYNRKIKEYADEYNKNTKSIQKYNLEYNGNKSLPKNNSREKAVKWDKENYVQNIELYIANRFNNSNINKLSEEELKTIIQSEINLYERFQNLREQKNIDGSHKDKLVTDILQEALIIYKNVFDKIFNNDPKNGKEAALAAEKEANIYINNRLSELGV